ncbi:Hypothetical predicted protein [Mytilus galloprovincialis]|uniref:Uncharacterized protein n=1 Tax=Mytilus galloprovincialis TaxID=29158 RepID=A0A8B6DZQ2_MYTGA|nr:Hypothetical predicted protein [Mytilus galloprovincialis]VDI27000.1 Hypothetical predicted protein [Mytilus galloprovincialis]
MSLLQTIRKALKSKSKSSISLKYKVDDDERLLFAAINEGNFQIARSLVEGKVSVNCKDSSGCTPMIAVCRLLTTKNITNKTADIVKFVTFLIEQNAFLHERDIFGRSALDYSCENDGNDDIRQLFHGAIQQSLHRYL